MQLIREGNGIVVMFANLTAILAGWSDGKLGSMPLGLQAVM